MMLSILRPIEKRENAVVVLLWILLLADSLSLIPSYGLLNTLKEIETAGPSFNITDAQNALYLNITVLALKFLLNIGVIIAFLMWMRRAYYNISTRVQMEDSDGWAVGYWFIPILNFFKPYRMMKEMFTKTSDYLERNLESFRPFEFKAMLRWWWVLWILVSLISNISTRLTGDSIRGIEIAFQLDCVTTVLSVPLTFLAVRVVRRYSDMAYDMNRVTADADGNINDDFSAHLTTPDLG